MPAFTKLNIADVDDIAASYGLGDVGEARFLRDRLGAKAIGMAHYRVNPGKRIGFGHRHESAEELYLVLSGSGRMKLDDEIVELAERDVVFAAPSVMREWEAGDGGLELLAFGAHAADDTDMQKGWWV